MTNSDQSHDDVHADGIVEAGNKAPIYFYLLFFGLIAWGVIFTGYYLFSGWSSGAEFEEKMTAYNTSYKQATPAVAAVTDTSGVDAAGLFATYCAGCHGADGKGGFGSDLSSSAYKYGRGRDAVRSSIADGRGGRMPPFGGQLKAAEIDALTDYSLNVK